MSLETFRLIEAPPKNRICVSAATEPMKEEGTRYET